MERLVIIDHANHTVFFEDVDTDFLEENYNGDEEAYIEDSYTFEGDYSWDYVVDVEYVDENGDVIDLDIDSWL